MKTFEQYILELTDKQISRQKSNKKYKDKQSKGKKELIRLNTNRKKRNSSKIDSDKEAQMIADFLKKNK